MAEQYWDFCAEGVRPARRDVGIIERGLRGILDGMEREFDTERKSWVLGPKDLGDGEWVKAFFEKTTPPPAEDEEEFEDVNEVESERESVKEESEESEWDADWEEEVEESREGDMVVVKKEVEEDEDEDEDDGVVVRK